MAVQQEIVADETADVEPRDEARTSAEKIRDLRGELARSARNRYQTTGRWIKRRRAILTGSITLMVLVAVCFHPQAQLGTVPTWISAFGAVATCVGVLLALKTYRTQKQQGLEEQANQARLINAVLMPGTQRDGKFTWWVTIENRSDKSIYGVHVRSLRAQVAEEGPAVRLSPMAITKIGELELVTGAIPMERELKAGTSFRTQWRAIDDGDNTSHVDGPIIQYTLTDANGRVWLIADNNEPEKIARPARPSDQRRRVV